MNKPNLSLSSGATSIVVHFNSSIGSGTIVDFQEWSFTGSFVSLDSSNNVDNTTNTLRTGVALTLTGSNDLIVQAITIGSPTITTCSSPYLTTTDFGSGFGVTSAANTTNGAAPTWAWTPNTNSQSAGSAIAISEAPRSAGSPTKVGAFMVGP
jgi:hypothetical protein